MSRGKRFESVRRLLYPHLPLDGLSAPKRYIRILWRFLFGALPKMPLGSVWPRGIGRLHSGKEVRKRRELSKTMEEYWGEGEHQRDHGAFEKRQLQPENGEAGILPAGHPSLVRKRIAVKGER